MDAFQMLPGMYAKRGVCVPRKNKPLFSSKDVVFGHGVTRSHSTDAFPGHRVNNQRPSCKPANNIAPYTAVDAPSTLPRSTSKDAFQPLAFRPPRRQLVQPHRNPPPF
jgi:hypothetical protein